MMPASNDHEVRIHETVEHSMKVRENDRKSHKTTGITGEKVFRWVNRPGTSGMTRVGCRAANLVESVLVSAADILS